MNKTVKLAKGAVEVFEFSGAKLHVYNTNDPIGDTVFLLEKNGKMAIIEQPCFFDNIKELTDYIKNLHVTVEGKIAPYHMAGGTFLPEVAVYATKKAGDYGHTGGGKGLIDNFTGVFGAAFDASIPKVTNFIQGGKTEIGGIGFNIIETAEAFDIEVPDLNLMYTHMLGADTHSIAAGKEHTKALISQLNGFISKKYDLILSSHHMPENLNDVETKIAYLEELLNIAEKSGNAQEFKKMAEEKFPEYYGKNYLDMTAEFFFPSK